MSNGLWCLSSLWILSFIIKNIHLCFKKKKKPSTFKKQRSWHPVPSLMKNRWGKSRNRDRFYFLGLQNHCRLLLLGRKVVTHLDSVLKSQDSTLPTKVCIVKTMVFQVVTYRCERWTLKKTEHWRIDAFQLWCWRRLLRVLWTARSNQSLLKEINPDYSLERLMLKLKLQILGHLIQRANPL